MSAGTLIVGAGQAGLQTAASLREAGYADPITLIGDEPTLPYQRPPLSKAYLAGKTDAQGLWLRPPAYLEQHRITLLHGTRAEAIDRSARSVSLQDATALPYEHLVLATGSRNRALSVPGANLAGVYQLRSLADADALRAAMAEAKRVAVVGAGFIGLEFAAVCAAAGLDVTVIEAAARVMARAVSEETSARFQAAHATAGVTLLFESGVQAIEGRDGRVSGVTLASGRALPAELVVVGIGVLPNQELAKEAGLATQDGITVDAFLTTSDPCISAIGDCARFPTRFAHRVTADGYVRIESVQNAIDQGRCLAARLTGRPAAYEAVPWFWSDQGANKLQIAGLAAESDIALVLGTEAAYSVLRFRDDRLSAVESVNRTGDHMAARKILGAGTLLSAERASLPEFDLKAFAMGRG